MNGKMGAYVQDPYKFSQSVNSAAVEQRFTIDFGY